MIEIKSELTEEEGNRLNYSDPTLTEKQFGEKIERLGKIQAKINQLDPSETLGNYRITAERLDVLEHIIWTLSGVTEEQAKAGFEKFKDNPDHSLEFLRLIRFEERLVDTRNPYIKASFI